MRPPKIQAQKDPAKVIRRLTKQVAELTAQTAADARTRGQDVWRWQLMHDALHHIVDGLVAIGSVADDEWEHKLLDQARRCRVAGGMFACAQCDQHRRFCRQTQRAMVKWPYYDPTRVPVRP